MADEREGRKKRKTVKEAVTLFIQDCEARNLKEGTIALYRQTLLQQLVPWCETEKIGEDVRKLDTEKLREYRLTWKCAPTTASLRIYRLRTFFGFCGCRLDGQELREGAQAAGEHGGKG